MPRRHGHLVAERKSSRQRRECSPLLPFRRLRTLAAEVPEQGALTPLREQRDELSQRYITVIEAFQRNVN